MQLSIDWPKSCYSCVSDGVEKWPRFVFLLLKFSFYSSSSKKFMFAALLNQYELAFMFRSFVIDNSGTHAGVYARAVINACILKAHSHSFSLSFDIEIVFLLNNKRVFFQSMIRFNVKHSKSSSSSREKTVIPGNWVLPLSLSMNWEQGRKSCYNWTRIKLKKCNRIH